MTVIGRDRPGLVESVARIVADHGGNWLESRMSRLGGHFAGILRVEVPRDRAQPLAAALEKLAAEGLTVVTHADEPAPAVADGRLSALEIIAQDRPGIVSQITRALANHRVNVEELHTESSSAAMSGETLFKAKATLSIPASCDTAELRRELERIAADLIAEISWSDLAAQ
jgi:glycine cleavage system regulatory protein